MVQMTEEQLLSAKEFLDDWGCGKCPAYPDKCQGGDCISQILEHAKQSGLISDPPSCEVCMFDCPTGLPIECAVKLELKKIGAVFCSRWQPKEGEYQRKEK